jgi:hypothetical protein
MAADDRELLKTIVLLQAELEAERERNSVLHQVRFSRSKTILSFLLQSQFATWKATLAEVIQPKQMSKLTNIKKRIDI